MSSSQEFLDDPVGFAKDHALVPDRGKEETAKLKSKTVNPALTLYQVKGKNRILFANIERKVDATNLYEVQFSEAQLGSAWFPIYWLPWQENETYRITLKHSEKNLVFDRNDRLVDPHIFFTATLSGCVVHVDGDPWQPTVYHSNAKAIPIPPPPNVKVARTWDASKRVEAMQERIGKSHKTFPKGPSHYAPQSTTAFDYSRYATMPDGSDWLLAQGVEELDPDANTMAAAQYGTVFGVRSKSTGLWSFYYQGLHSFKYLKNGLRFETWTVDRCQRFWPGSDISKPIPIVIVDD